jgi:hypothetical protein
MSLNFPASPTLYEVHTENGRTFRWNGESWVNTSSGYTGSVGFTGSTGFTGSQGIQGDLGYTGSQGFTGSQGVGFTGSQGVIGYTGSGVAGASVTVSETPPSSPESGDLWWNSHEGKLKVWYVDVDSSQWVDASTGAIGDTGYTGSQGIIGYTGSQGDLGYTGSIGYTGSQGNIGYTGSKGDTGAIGTTEISFSIPGTLTTRTGTMRWYFDNNYTIDNVIATVGTAPTGASIIVDVNKNGTTIFTTQANRPTITASSFTDLTSTPNVTTVASGDYLTVDIDQIGSTIAGTDLVVRIKVT